MFEWLAKTTGQLIGETVHQTGKLAETTVDLVKDTVESIGNIPEAFAEGYDEELFAKKEEGTSDDTTSDDTGDNK